MPVRVGDIELPFVQGLHTEEQRNLAERRAPEQKGGGFQDLGREPVVLVLDGFLHGEGAAATLEKLRAAQARAEPLSFAADIAAGTEVARVVIESVRVRQLAGYASRYQYLLRLREHVEPPEPAGAGNAAVEAAAREDAAAWGEGQMRAGVALQDPAGLADALAENPAMLANLDAADLGDALARNLDALPTESLDDALGAVAELDPAKANGVLARLQQSGSLGAMLGKYLESGVAFLRKLDPAKLRGLMAVFQGGLEFLQQLLKVAKSFDALVEAIRELEPPPILALLLPKGAPP